MNVRPALAVVCACGLASSARLVAQEAPAETPRASSMFTERANRRAAFRNEPAVAAVRAGLGWLVEHQDEKGGWDCDGFMKHDKVGKPSDGPGSPAEDLGVSALALLALLAQADPVHHDATHLAADYVASMQHAPSGRFYCEAHDWIYTQAIATLAMVEAAAVLGDARYRTAASNGLRYLESHHNAGAAWRYERRDGNDTSITAWCVAAYGAAVHAGFAVSADSVAEALAWLESVTTFDLGHCGYSARGEPSARMAGNHAGLFPIDLTEVCTAAGMHMRAIAGLSPASRLNRVASALLLKKPPAWGKQSTDFYYWCHGSEAMAAFPEKADALKWYSALQKALVPTQRKDGAFQGSWDPVDPWSESGGRIYATALAVLALSSPYRLGPTSIANLVPDVPPFRRVHALFVEGKLGAALVALAEVKGGATTAQQQEQIRRIDWFASVQTTFGERVLAKLVELYPDFRSRCDRLEELVASLPGTAPGKAAAAALQALLTDPANRDELEATTMLHAILASYDRYKPPKEPGKSAALRDRFEKLVAKYPKTDAAKEALQCIQYLR